MTGGRWGVGRERPWHRPGALGYAWRRVRGFLRPPVEVTEAEPGRMVQDLDVPVTMADGTLLRANVYRPPGDGPFPVILCAHPYGKDNLPRRHGRRATFSFQYRIMRQPAPVTISTSTSWEAPDPVYWTAQGYVVVNADLRGAGSSAGVGRLFSDAEARDIFELIEWAAHRTWSTGKVGMLGVSYLAIAQYKVAALAPPSLHAICPWEAMTDPYRDLMRPGGIEERGFSSIWAAACRRTCRLDVDLGAQKRRRPLRDDWWQSLVPDLARIEVPMLVCASFSDNLLHSRGSFRAFMGVGSSQRFAYTHRGGKWSTFSGDEARRTQLAFFDRFLRGSDTPVLPRVRLEVREERDRIVEVRDEHEWPLARTTWTPLYLTDALWHGAGACDGRRARRGGSTGTGLLVERAPDSAAQLTFDGKGGAVAFSYRFGSDVELTGPMALSVWVSVEDADDVDLIVGVEKWRGRHYVGFEGSYGFGRDRVTTGWLRASLRALDADASSPGAPVHTYRTSQKLQPGEIVPVEVALGPSSTLFRAGETLKLVVAGRWLWPTNPLTGQFPARYRTASRGSCTLHVGADHPAHLLVPRIPPSAPGGS